MSVLPIPIIAETIATPTDMVIEQSEKIVIEDEQTVEEVPDEPDEPNEETEFPPMEDDGDAAFPEDDPPVDDDAGDLPADDIVSETETEEPSGDDPVIEDEPATEWPEEYLSEGEFDVIDEPLAGDEPIVEDADIPVFFSAMSPLRFTGDEDVRLGKESSNINGIIVQKNGSNSTSIARHWVTVDGVEYIAFCIEASDSATSGRDGGL